MNSLNNLLLNRFKICHNLVPKYRKYRNCRTIWSSRHSIRIKSKQNIESKVNQRVRHIFGFPQKPSNIQKYSERRLLGYSKEKLFEVVSKVEEYHLFVPACVKSQVIERRETYLRAELEIGIPPLIWEKYTSRVTLIRPTQVSAKCIDGKLFKHLDTIWKFSDGLPNNSQTCSLDFSVEFEFRSLFHSQLVHVFFDEMARQTVNAFLRRAEQLYGKPSPLTPGKSSGNPLTHKT